MQSPVWDKQHPGKFSQGLLQGLPHKSLGESLTHDISACKLCARWAQFCVFASTGDCTLIGVTRSLLLLVVVMTACYGKVVGIEEKTHLCRLVSRGWISFLFWGSWGVGCWFGVRARLSLIHI